MIDTILFDLDGTLVNTNEIIINSFRHVFEIFHPDDVPNRDKIISFIGPTLHETFSKYSKTKEQTEQMVQTYLSHYREIENDMFELFDGVIDVLKTLKREGYNLGIVTTKYRKSATPSLIHFGLDKIFNVIVTLDDVQNPKPSSEPIEVALKDIKHNDVIMVGDNRNDILAGKNASVYTCGVSWTTIGKDKLIELEPDFMLDKMSDLLTILNIR